MDKKTSAALKGIALLMMLFHHLFRLNKQFSGYDISFAPLGKGLVMDIAVACKICVSIFAFISGYGLFISYEKFSRKSEPKNALFWTIVRYIKTMSGYWFIFILSTIYCQMKSGLTYEKYFEGNSNVAGFFYMTADFFGVSQLIGTPKLGGSWWYMSAAVVYIFLTPLICEFIKKYGCTYSLICAVILPRLLQIRKLDGTNSILGFLFVFILGMIFAKNDIINRWIKLDIFQKFYMRIIKLLCEAALICGLYILYTRLSEVRFWELLWGIIPAAVIVFAAEFIAVIPVLRSVFAFLGKHSMNIFLTHLFIKTVYYKDFIYGRGHFLTITAVLLIFSLAVSLGIELIKWIIRYDRLIEMLIGRISALQNPHCEKIETKNEIPRETEKIEEKMSV